jgi:hypothetical protein
MKKIVSIITILLLLVGAWSCKKDSEFLDVQPTAFLTTDQVFSDPALALSVLADLYNRQVDFSSLDGGWTTFTDFSESFPSENSAFAKGIVQNTSWGYGTWSIDWSTSYTYIRDLNLFLERDSASTGLAASDKAEFYAEARFLRANFYFEMVKRYGGVPLITSSLTYDYKGDPTYLQNPRAKESDIYDFVISEAEAIKDQLPSGGDAVANQKSRATKGAALAMEARAALYAGSIAKYGASTPAVTLAGGEVGIDAGKANAYYTTALKAAQSIINGEAGPYALYKAPAGASPAALSDNFANVFLDKTSAETIFFEDFKLGKTHAFTTNDQPYSLSDEGGDAGRLDPSLNLAEAFEKTDNTYAPFATKDGSGKQIFYTNIQDIFADRDARLAGTILLPGGTYKGGTVDIWAGYQLADGSILTSDESDHLKPLPGTSTDVQVVGEDGPVNGLELRTQSGFYIRKYIDPAVGSGRRGQGSTVAFIRYRYAEVLLNAAEAAFELGDNTTAANYMNQVRARAGLTTPLTPDQITFDRVVHERRVELAFEGHILYDMKRWRLATKVWDGAPVSATDLTSNIGSATKHSTQPWGLWPYKVYNPGDPSNGKWVFKETLPALVTGTNRFLIGNYYSQIADNVIAANPKIVRQPNQ